MAHRHRPDDDQGRVLHMRRRDENGLPEEAPRLPEGADANVFLPSDGARLVFPELLRSPAQMPAPETHFPTIGRAVVDPQGLTLLSYDSMEPLIPNVAPDFVPSIQLMNENEGEAVGGYAMVRELRTLGHAWGWGSLYCGIQFDPVPGRPGTFRAPEPGKFVAIKKLNKRVVDLYLQHGSATVRNRDLRHLDDAYMALVMQVQDRENPFKEMSRMDEFGDNIHVLRQIEFLQDQEHIYIIMPYAVGRVSLDMALFRPHQELTREEARGFFCQILRILAYLEENGIHHRDLSPDNFIFYGEDHLVVMDLAMSMRIPVDAATGRRTLITGMGRQGTPAFMCPEIYNNFRVFDGVSADLWSAMLILYAMLTNIPMYRRPDVLDISYRFYVVAGGITQNDVNELVMEILDDVFDETDGNPTHQHILSQQAMAHLGLPPSARDLFHFFFRINPGERLTLAQVMESEYVASGED